MKAISRLGLLIAVLLVLVACQPVPGPVATPLPGSTEPAAAPSAPASPLAGTGWVLSSLGGALPVSGTTVTLEFGADGSVFGSDGCNRFRTTYVQDGTSLTIKQPMASTMMACPEVIMNQATAFSNALGQTTNFVGDEKQLILRSDSQILATLIAVSESLADTAWDVISYNNGREAVVGLITGTEITALFGAGGDLTGNAGCNEYFTSYELSGNNIKIGMPGQTMRFCAEPPGVMEQETEYLAALQSAATYSVEGDTMQMRTAADALAVLMVRREIVDLPVSTPEPEQPAVPTARVAGSQGVNVRSGPGGNFPVLGVARFGDEGEIVGRSADGGWWAVSVPSAPNGVGWVSADLVIATNAANVPVIESPPPPTVAPTAVPTSVPTAIPPTPAPVPTATPVPQISFWADRTQINQGECATLNWDVRNVQAVWVYPQGADFNAFPRTGQGNERVCPGVTTTYEMRVQLNDGSTQFRQVTINVIQPIAPPQPPTVAPPAVDPLAGTRWTVMNVNNGIGAVTGLIPGTTISLEFDIAGRVSGKAGCNSYSANYRAGGNSLTVDQPSATSMMCETPEGVMQQEQQYLDALHSAATFQISGDQLQIRSGADALAVAATRAP